jgi:uncharacterized protein (TIGR02246 family)
LERLPDGGIMIVEDDRLTRLVAIEEIKQLKARYFRSLDHKDWEEFGRVFTGDAVMEVPEADIVVNGREAIVESVSSALTGTRTVHHGYMPEIEISGPDTARGTWAMSDYVEWPTDQNGNRVGLTGYGHYLESYVRTDDQWRIAKLHLARLRVDPLGS